MIATSRRSNRELWLAFLTIGLVTLAYLGYVSIDGVPAASGWVGHIIGVIGFLLMLMTETLYSLRKRSRVARWGRTSSWLNFHIYTGIVGPYLVLLHSSWKFNGLAGVVLLLTVVIVVSGFIGRYIYTAIPRTADGREIEVESMRSEMSSLHQDLQLLLADQPELALKLGLDLGQSASLDMLEDNFLSWRQRLNWRWLMRSQPQETRRQLARFESMLTQHARLHRQLKSLANARRLMASWHTIHIPIGMALFTAAFIHILAALYYATFLK